MSDSATDKKILTLHSGEQVDRQLSQRIFQAINDLRSNHQYGVLATLYGLVDTEKRNMEEAKPLLRANDTTHRGPALQVLYQYGLISLIADHQPRIDPEVANIVRNTLNYPSHSNILGVEVRNPCKEMSVERRGASHVERVAAPAQPATGRT